MKTTIIVLAMHGVPPSDFPKHETGELFRLHGQIARASEHEREALQRRHDELEEKMRAWPRNGQNDPFFVGSQELADKLSGAAGCEVIVGFNEFCGPSVEEAIEQAVGRGADEVVTITPMMTRGGEHSEQDIASSVSRAQLRHPAVRMVYAWPFLVEDVAGFLAAQVARFKEEHTLQTAAHPRE
jgi:sirohydrochlorin cobaltochelatase